MTYVYTKKEVIAELILKICLIQIQFEIFDSMKFDLWKTMSAYEFKFNHRIDIENFEINLSDKLIGFLDCKLNVRFVSCKLWKVGLGTLEHFNFETHVKRCRVNRKSSYIDKLP